MLQLSVLKGTFDHRGHQNIIVDSFINTV